MKKVIPLTLAFAMAASLTLPALAVDTTFSDVTGTWSESYVTDLVGKGVVNGYSDGTFKPENPVTRGAIAKMVLTAMQANGSTIKVTTTGTKMTGTSWSAEYVTPLVDQGIVSTSDYPKGYGESVAMSRLETIKILVRTYLHAHPDESLPTDATLTFADASKISTADKPYVKMGVDLGIINGYVDATGSTVFGPNGNIKRSTAAAMIDRFITIVGQFSDHIGAASGTRTDGQITIDTSSAPTLQNVEWAIQPTITVNYSGLASTYFSEVSPDGMSSYWTSDDKSNPTYVDLDGNTYTYQGVRAVGNFIHGYAPALSTSNGKWGYIDFSGNWVIQPTLDLASDLDPYYYKDGTVVYYGMVTYNGNNQYAFSASDQKIIPWSAISLTNLDYEKSNGVDYDEPTPKDGSDLLGSYTSSGLFVTVKHMGSGATEDNYYGICDKDGNVIISPSFTSSLGNPSHDTYISATVYDDCIVLLHKYTNTWDCISDIYDGTTGKLLYSYYNTREHQPFRAVQNYGQGIFAYCDRTQYTDGSSDVLWGYMDKDGTVLIPMAFQKALPFSNGYAWVEYQGKWGLIKMPNT